MNTQAQGNLEARTPQHSTSFEREIIGHIPQLRAFSRALCRNQQTAEDLAQEALAKAWRSRASFALGSNLKAWLFTIFRNEFYSHCRRIRRENDLDGNLAERIEDPPDQQHWAAELSDTIRALRQLPAVQREALILVGAAGFSYLEAAQICGTPVGTTKSRIARARIAVAAILESGPRQTRNNGSETEQSAVLHQ